MATPAVSTNFGDLLDPRFQKIFNERYKQLPDMLNRFFSMKSGADAPTKADFRTSQVGTLGDIPEFTGTVVYDDSAQGYDSTITPKEYASGYQIERKLYDDDLYGVMDQKPKALATAFQRTRQKHGAQLFNNAFSLDGTWNNHTEGVALCSDSHTTTSGAATTNGFDNLSTAALSAVALAANRIQMINFRGDRAERISVVPSMILIPPDLYEQAYEIVESAGKLDTPNNNANVHEGRYTVVEWIYLDDVNNWFLIDETAMKDALVWVDRVQQEFAMVEDFDTFVAKWRLYARYGHGHNDWRWILGNQVS
jgi:hypothetical protein